MRTTDLQLVSIGPTKLKIGPSDLEIKADDVQSTQPPQARAIQLVAPMRAIDMDRDPNDNTVFGRPANILRHRQCQYCKNASETFVDPQRFNRLVCRACSASYATQPEIPSHQQQYCCKCSGRLVVFHGLEHLPMCLECNLVVPVMCALYYPKINSPVNADIKTDQRHEWCGKSMRIFCGDFTRLYCSKCVVVLPPKQTPKRMRDMLCPKCKSQLSQYHTGPDVPLVCLECDISVSRDLVLYKSL